MRRSLLQSIIGILLINVISIAIGDANCPDDGSISPTHQDIQFTFLHNQTHDFARYRVQTNITFRLTTENSSILQFHLHGRCPSWAPILNNGSYLLITSPATGEIRRSEVIFTCCQSEKDTMSALITLESSLVSSIFNYTLVLSALEEKTESDLAGVTRVPLSPVGALLPPSQHKLANYSGDAMVMTNFHDIFVRHSFPLIDSLTALYTVSLSITVDESFHRRHHHDDLTVLANTPVNSISNSFKRSHHGVLRRQRTWTFDSSPLMPGSYLAFVIGRFRRNTLKTKRGVDVSIWTLPNPASTIASHLDSTRFALEMTSALLAYFEEEFAFPYPLSKLDIVEAPLDYEAFIVWGLCFVKPGRLHVIRSSQPATAPGGPLPLFTGAQSMRETIPKKKEITEMLAHEIAHQWFGSLVTPRTWNDVFLSESFATFYGVEAVRFARGVPQWMASEAMITALTHRKISLHTDPTIPISSSIMYKNWSRDVQFSTIVYHKGATLLRMLKWVIGDKAFRNGIRKYLRRNQYSNVGADHFLDALDETVRDQRIAGWDPNEPLDVKAFMKAYLYQPSYPIINVRVNRTHAVLSQEPYQRQNNAQPTTYQWYVPITVHLQSKQMRTYWLKPNETLSLKMDDFGFMVRLFHLYVVKPIQTEPVDGDEAGEDQDREDNEDGNGEILD